jgi:methionyl-tRNA formyltransferase
MSCRVIAFVDHEIGYRLLEKMISGQTVFDFELVAVVTTQDNGQMWWTGVAHLCHQSRIPLHRYHEPFNIIFDYSNVDWYFLLSWKHIIPSELIEHPKLGVINLHYSLLPEYRGVYPINWAIIEGREKTGVTYHLVSEKIDAGCTICQRATHIHLSDTARTLQLRLDDLAYELFDEMLELALRRNFRKSAFVAPSETRGSYRTRTDFIESNELDLNREYRAIDLLNLLRGKTFLPDSKNLYAIDPVTGNRIYISVSLDASE